ncbi:hypothetical protein HGRIS_014584 [Hohenbuehelia grisea]|uniref:Autophagy-related protein 4 n=1 Tax=Hohenbuehelia grisea TaxID=104357 RepID=A0ABR3JW24_9AGAR
MSNKQSRQTPTPPTPTHHGSKLPKFLQKQNRDRSKSMTDPGTGSSSSSLVSGTLIPDLPPSTPSSKFSHTSRKSKLLGVREKQDPRPSSPSPSQGSEPPNTPDDTPVIVEPIAVPRSRTRSERPLSTASDTQATSTSLYASTSSTSRIGDLPTRLSGWFSHTFSSSTTDLSLPNLIAQTHSLTTSSPPKAKGSALLTAAKHGKGHLDKALRWVTDSDAVPDRSPEPIWLLGVQHPGYEQPPPPTPGSLSSSTSSSNVRRSSVDSRKRGSSPSLRASTSSAVSAHELGQSQSAGSGKNPGAHWPPLFYADFTSRIWLTYRSQFTPIRDIRLCDLSTDPADQTQPSSPPARKWHWGGEKNWTSDSGWGCMLRTGQSLLANTLIHLHISRDWRRTPSHVSTADFATYVQILSWFFDTPEPEAPFSVHRMALAGKDLGKDVGQWFGPSTAAGAIKTLVHSFPEAGLGVAVGADGGVVFQSDVYAASNMNGSPRRHARARWGNRPVLILIGVRLGIDGVNPIYYEAIKFLFTWPQSVGIAGGRPSSSYYFVGSQGDSLFYLDPHYARPAIPLRPFTPPSAQLERAASVESSDQERKKKARPPTTPTTARTSSSGFVHAPMSPSPLQQQYSSASAPPSHHAASSSSRARWQTTSQTGSSQPGSPATSTLDMDPSELVSAGDSNLDEMQRHFVNAYTPAELKTFHCDRPRKMGMGSLDPSMLLGFLCKDEHDWIDFRRRVEELSKNYKTIFSVQDEPPSWPSDSDDSMGLESISEPDDMDMDMDSDGDGDGEEQFFDTRSGTPSTSSASQGAHTSSDGGIGKPDDQEDTEEDPVDPITPGPTAARFEVGARPWAHGADRASKDDSVRFDEGDDFDDGTDIEDDWVDPSVPSPSSASQDRQMQFPASRHEVPPTPPAPLSSPESSTPQQSVALSGSASTSKPKKKSTKKGAEKAVPVPRIPSSGSTGSHPHGQYASVQQAQAPLPFPVSHRPEEAGDEDAEPVSQHERLRTGSIRAAPSSGGGSSGKRMHTARARDGGRTQSGGVRGVLTTDS